MPDIPAAKLACTDDHPLADGSLPCPETHWCSGEHCIPRLGCRIANANRAGCDPTQSCEHLGLSCMRCEARINLETAAVRCEPGLHTTTSTRPRTLNGCECPDGTFCVAFQDGGAAGTYPLFFLPRGRPLPIGRLGFGAEIPEWRVCARACSSELDCPASHTCRAAAVVGDDLIQHPTSSRHTIGVCYPNRLTSTSTHAPIRQPDPNGCQEKADCAEICQYRVTEIPDHPTIPAGPAWGHRFALLPQCTGLMTSQLDNDEPCTRGEQCKSGLCASNGRCSIPCNPMRPGSCPPIRDCSDVLVKRELPGGMEVEDRAHICSPR